jgi:hypothetical protein
VSLPLFEQRSPRRFNLGDGLILVAALAVASERLASLGWFESFPKYVTWVWQPIAQLAGWTPWTRFIGYRRRELITLVAAESTNQLVLMSLCPVLLGLMAAQPLLGLRRPRPPLAHVFRQSGFVTCMIGNALVLSLFLLIGAWWFSETALSLWLTRAIIVLLLWPILGLPPWRTERSWIDRLGRAVGWGWIVAMLSVAALQWMGEI